MAILATEKVLTLDWWKPADKLEVGDYVFDKDGKIVQIKLIQQYYSENCKRVTFNDHLSVAGDDKLNFMVEDLKYRHRLRSIDYAPGLACLKRSRAPRSDGCASWCGGNRWRQHQRSAWGGDRWWWSCERRAAQQRW